MLFRRRIEMKSFVALCFIVFYFQTTHSYHVRASRVNNELSEVLSRLWDLDANRCNPGVDYTLNLQGYVTSLNWNLTDRANLHLFSSFNEQLVFSKPTYRAFKALLDNYAENTDTREIETMEEKGEIDTFLMAILNTDVMRETHRFLVRKNKVSSDVKSFKNLLYNLWFKLYKRMHEDRQVNSCGFEHVFVGEKRRSEVTGFHNWIQFYRLEKLGDLDYRGYFRRGTTEEIESSPRVMTLQFILKRTAGKGISSMLMGTSPEFEMAMYTIVHALRMRQPVVDLKQYKLELVTYPHGNSIGSAFPRSLGE